MKVAPDTLENPYLLLTPGPLSTSRGVRQAMLRDWCTWSSDYNEVVQGIRYRLVQMATSASGYTSVLMQGSGTFSVESVIGSAVPEDGKILILVNGAYGQRMVKICERLRIDHVALDFGEVNPPNIDRLNDLLEQNKSITHVAVVHCETTTGMLNDVKHIAEVVKAHDKIFIADAMSSFGGIPMDLNEWKIDFLISSANKCIQGVPGFGFVIAPVSRITACRGLARSLSLDLYDQWETMEAQKGKWRYTSPTHTVKAFAQALIELEEEGGIEARNKRYVQNHEVLITGMRKMGFQCLLSDRIQSPIITSFLYPESPVFNFNAFYDNLKSLGFVIYPGKVTRHDTFRIGNIGHVFPKDMEKLIEAVKQSIFW